jgi:hypothetical protein
MFDNANAGKKLRRHIDSTIQKSGYPALTPSLKNYARYHVVLLDRLLKKLETQLGPDSIPRIQEGHVDMPSFMTEHRRGIIMVYIRKSLLVAMELKGPD